MPRKKKNFDNIPEAVITNFDKKYPNCFERCTTIYNSLIDSSKMSIRHFMCALLNTNDIFSQPTIEQIADAELLRLYWNWLQTKIIFNISEFTTYYDCEIDMSFNVSKLSHLPYKCFYINFNYASIKGVFVQIGNIDGNDFIFSEKLTLSLIALPQNKIFDKATIFIELKNHDNLMNYLKQSWYKTTGTNPLTCSLSSEQLDEYAEFYAFVINLIYCIYESNIYNATTSNNKIIKNDDTKSSNDKKYFKLNNKKIIFREYTITPSSVGHYFKHIGSSKSTHIRKGHWHNYWIGSGENKHLELRWLEELIVNADKKQEIKTVVLNT